jgi:hypothetical protein
MSTTTITAKPASPAQVKRIGYAVEYGLLPADFVVPSDSYACSGVIGNLPASKRDKQALIDAGGSVKPKMTSREVERAMLVIKSVNAIDASGSKSEAVIAAMQELRKEFFRKQS